MKKISIALLFLIGLFFVIFFVIFFASSLRESRLAGDFSTTKFFTTTNASTTVATTTTAILTSKPHRLIFRVCNDSTNTFYCAMNATATVGTGIRLNPVASSTHVCYPEADAIIPYGGQFSCIGSATGTVIYFEQ